MAIPPPSLLEIVRRCLAGHDPEAWTELVHVSQPMFARIAYRVMLSWGLRPNAADIDDIVQEIYGKLAAKGGFVLNKIPLEIEAAAQAYLKVIATNCAQDYLKRCHAEKRGANRTQSASDNLDGLAGTLDSQDVERNILLKDVDAVLPSVGPERTIFWLYYRQGYTAKEISLLPGCRLGSKGVESLIYRLTAAVRKALKKRRDSTDHFSEGESA